MTVRKTSRPSRREDPLGQAAPAEVLHRHLELRRSVSVVLLALLSMLLVGIAFAPFDCWYLGYLSLVPWVLAVAGGKFPRRTILIGWASGAVFWAAMLYWLTLPTVGGYIAVVIYLSLYWLIAAVLVRKTMRRDWPMWITLPVIWVALEVLRSRFPILSFPWFLMGQTQYQQSTIIQIADVTGQFGISFFVVMVNGLLVDLLSSPLFVQTTRGPRLGRQILHGLVACGVVLAALLGYGRWRLNQTDVITSIDSGPMIGIVQQAFPISLYGELIPSQTFIDAHLVDSMRFIDQPCDLVVWPETMLTPGMNRQLLETDLKTLPDDQIRSLAGLFYGPSSAAEYTVKQLRASLRSHVGYRAMEFYRGPAARYVIHQFLTPQRLERVPDRALRRVGAMLFGERAGSVERPVLREAVGMYLAEPPVATTAPASDRDRMAAQLNTLEAARLVVGDEIAGDGDSPDTQPALHEQARKKIRRQLAGDAEWLDNRKARVAMLETTAALLDCPIMAGGTGLYPNPRPIGPEDLWIFHNSVLWFGPREGLAANFYAKTHLVPFSEHVPFKYSWTGLHKLLRMAVPEQMPQLDPGEGDFRFYLRRGGESIQLITPICYEGSIGQVCRRMVAAGPKDRLVMINLSNDGWFVYGSRQGGYRGTTEHAQHLMHYPLRAVENRVPIARAVNTGISALIDSAGRIQSVLETDAPDGRQRTMVTGTLRGRLNIDPRTPLYIRIGDTFGLGVCIAAAGLLAGLAWTSTKRSRGTME